MTDPTPAVRASDAEREHAVEVLRAHAVDGRLTLEEFAQRVDTAYAARMRDELEQLTRDLPAVPAAAPAGRRPRAARRWIVSILGGTERRGRWRLARDINVVSILGGAELDLRDAELEDLDTTITVVAVLGGCEITVPEGVDVDLTGFVLLGGKEYNPGRSRAHPSAPSIRIRVFAVLGGVEVNTR